MTMLPCQKNCANYHEGCHRACVSWHLFQNRQKEQREAKKAYLRYHLERCTQAVHQLESLQLRRQVW